MQTNPAAEQDGGAPAAPPLTPPLPVLQGRPAKPNGYREGTLGGSAQAAAMNGVVLLIAVVFLFSGVTAVHAPKALVDAVLFGGLGLVLLVEVGALVTGIVAWRQPGSRFAVVVGSLFLLAPACVALAIHLISLGIL